MIYRLITFAFLIAESATVIAVTPPPVKPIDQHPWQKPVERETPTRGINMGPLRIQFEKTTLDEVRRAALVGEISQQGDAAENIYWLCYTNVQLGLTERIWVISNGEVGGFEHSVTEINAQLLPNGEATPDCPKLPPKLTPLSLDNNLWLNSTEDDLVKKLGIASHQTKSWRSYYYHNQKLDSGNWLWVQTGDGRVTSLSTGQETGF